MEPVVGVEPTVVSRQITNLLPNRSATPAYIRKTGSVAPAFLPGITTSVLNAYHFETTVSNLLIHTGGPLLKGPPVVVMIYSLNYLRCITSLSMDTIFGLLMGRLTLVQWRRLLSLSIYPILTMVIHHTFLKLFTTSYLTYYAAAGVTPESSCTWCHLLSPTKVLRLQCYRYFDLLAINLTGVVIDLGYDKITQTPVPCYVQ